MKPFTKQELKVVSAILFLIFVVTGLNIRIALRRARDAQRRADLGAISNALHEFYDDYGFFPPAENGKIKVCKADNFEKVFTEIKEADQFDRNRFISGLRTCDWGKDSLTDLGMFEGESETYIKTIPVDPKQSEGITYYYLSNINRFQLFSTLEGEDSEEGYNEGIVKRNLLCGNKICSFGKTYGATPLDKSIEEYESELQKKLNTGSN